MAEKNAENYPDQHLNDQGDGSPDKNVGEDDQNRSTRSIETDSEMEDDISDTLFMEQNKTIQEASQREEKGRKLRPRTKNLPSKLLKEKVLQKRSRQPVGASTPKGPLSRKYRYLILPPLI